MKRIHVLDKNVAEQIAAGEVVERPASVVKELTENAIDAGATAVTVEIRHGGITYIRVTDNGSGVEPDDVPTAFLRHATSKVQVFDDLNTIGTLGFRGEALASIAAVSRVEFVTKTHDAPYATRFCIEGGEETDHSETGAPDGTTIVVRDLFYNVPARLKFLKRDTAEAAQISGIVDRLALSHPEVSFKLLVDRKMKLHTPGNGKLLSAVHAVFGQAFAEMLLPVDYGMNGISVTGFVSKTNAGRKTRSMQHFFVNGRYIHTKLCTAALEEAYENAMMTGKYPSCVLNVSLGFDRVDVNVHPAKTEVRFAQEREVYDAVLSAVKAAVSRADIIKNAQNSPSLRTVGQNVLNPFVEQVQAEQTMLPQKSVTVVRQESPTEEMMIPASGETAQGILAKQTPNPLRTRSASSGTVHAPRADYCVDAKETTDFLPVAGESVKKQSPSMNTSFKHLKKDAFVFPDKEIKIILEEEEETQDKPTEPISNQPEPTPNVQTAPPLVFRMIGEVFSTYVLFELNESLFLLDKHAAHERILFERLKKNVSAKERQILLSPVVVNTSAQEYQAVLSHQELVQSLGFDWELFGNHSFLLREVPLLLAHLDVRDLFLDIAQKLCRQKQHISTDLYEELLHSMACRSAVKAHDDTKPEELQALLEEVVKNDEIRHCPHGRPVMISFSKQELERRFGRIQ